MIPRALRNRNFQRLWAAATIDSLGSWLLVFAVPLEVFKLTGSPTATGLALAIEALPVALIGPWAGVAVDRWNRKTVLVLATVAAAGGVAVMLVATTPFIYLGLAVENLAVCFQQPAVRAMMPTVLGRGSDLASPNAILSATNSLWRLLGPLAGTFLVARGWYEAVVIADLVSYLVAAAIIAGVRVTRGSTCEPHEMPRIRDGFRYIARVPLLRGLLATSWFSWTANTALTTLLIPFATIRLHASSQAVGDLIAGLGVGYLCGSTISKPLITRYATRSILTLAYALVGVCFLVTVTAMALPVAVIALTAAGVPGAVVVVVVGQQVQAATPDPVLGRVGSAFFTSDAIAAVAGALIAPAVVALTSLAAALDVVSMAVLATAAWACVLLPRGENSLAVTAADGDDGRTKVVLKGGA